MKTALKFCIVICFFLLLLSFTYDSHAQTGNQKKIHPVILIHGINSQDVDWDSSGIEPIIGTYLINDGYDMNYVTTFAYVPQQRDDELEDDSIHDTIADSHQSVKNIAPYLKNEIDFLYNKSGGVKVDIVTHSLGGIVTREYLRNNLDDHKIGKFIDLATPHSGSLLFQFFDSLPEEIQQGVLDALDYIADEYGYRPPDPSSEAAKDLVPNSPFLDVLNKAESPNNVQYWLLYGDIQFQIKIEFFWFEVYSHPLAAGDLIVSRENATTIPRLGSFEGPNPSYYHTVGFQSPTNLQLVANILLNHIDWNVEIDGPIDGFIPYWHSGLLRNPDVNQKILSILNDGYIPPDIDISAGIPPNLPNQSSTAMLFDVSGSMSEQDVTGITKMDAAKNSGERILDIIQAENSVSQGADVGILSFSNEAWVNSRPSADIDSARSALLGLFPLDATGMPDGLRLAIDQYAGTQNSKPIIILLSDGLPNVPLGSSGFSGDPNLARQQSLDLAAEAGAKGICIYTVGFGVPNTAGNLGSYGSIDEDFLKQIAVNSGCGAYYNAQDAVQLANVYVGLRHESTGNVLLSQIGNISQDETVDIAHVQVPDNQSMILYTLNWPGSRLDAVLTDPGGTVVDANYPNASFSTSDTLASIIIQAPQAGEWKVAAKGVDVPEGSTVYNAVMSVRPNPNPPTPVPVETPPATIPPNPGFPVVILMLVLAGGGVAIYVMVQTRAKGRTKVLAGASAAQLIGIGGGLTGQAVFLRDGMVAGRGSGSSLSLRDRAVSRQHAKFRFANGQWFVQDLSSQTGVFVNGVKVQATALKHGDHIRIGPCEFEFRTTR